MGKETEGNPCVIFSLGARVAEHNHDMFWQPPDLSTQAPLAEWKCICQTLGRSKRAPKADGFPVQPQQLLFHVALS